MKVQKNNNTAAQNKNRSSAPRPIHTRASVNSLRCTIYGLICYLAVLFIVLQAIIPTRYDIKPGDIASATITAPKEIKDKITTDRLIDQAIGAVEPVYSRNESITAEVLKNVNDALQAIASVRTQGINIRNEWLAENPDAAADDYTYQTTFIDTLISLLPFSSTQDEVFMLINASDAMLDQFSSGLLSRISNLLNQGIRSEQTEDKKNAIISELTLLKEPSLSNDFLLIASKILDQNLKANLKEDEAATLAAREAAAAAVEPVTYKKGQNIITQGEAVTEAQHSMLRELGLLTDQNFDFQLYGGIIGILLLLMFIVALYIRIFQKELIQEPKKILLMCILMVLIVLISMLILQAEARFVPFLFGTMLIAMLIGTRIAFVVNIVMSIIIGMIMSDASGLFSTNSVSVLLIGIISGSAVVFLCERPMHRMRIVITGLAAGAAGGVASALISMVLSSDLKQSLLNGLYPLLGGLLSAVICIGTLPVWESLFDILTPTKLLELTNSNQPLLRKLALEAPGTHHHSIVVANLAELGAEAIGADTMLVRAAAYYHDIGKLSAPECYTENQDNKQKSFHALLTPAESAAIIRSHTTNGYELALKYKLPMKIRQIIREHHGTTVTGYFYAKALETDPNVNIADFTYPGPKPSSKEAAIIMIADSVEAAVRSLPEKTPQNVRAKIDQLIKDRLASGQFDECDISMLELNKLAAEFTQALSAVHHDRIEYPDLKKAMKEHEKLETEKNEPLAEIPENTEPAAAEKSAETEAQSDAD